MSSDIILSVNGLHKKYKDIAAVDGVDFTVCRGEVFGLLGPNGAGKTTIINILCGLIKPDSGRIEINGLSMARSYKTIKTIIGVCPQDIVLWELLTCFEQLRLTGLFYGIPAYRAGNNAEKLLHQFGLWDKRHNLAKTLSGGMQRRLNMALALVHDPELIILDEPQAGLDPQSRILVRDYIRQLAKSKTIILTTHDMDEADRLSDRIAIIDHGKILMIDTPERIKAKSGAGDILQITTRHADGFVNRILDLFPTEITTKKYTDSSFYLEASELLELIPEISRIFKDVGVRIDDMTIRKRTLEDAFISLTGRGLRE